MIATVERSELVEATHQMCHLIDPRKAESRTALVLSEALWANPDHDRSHSRAACVFPMRLLISSRVKMALMGTEILPSLSHSNRRSRSGLKLFDLRVMLKKVVRLPVQKSRFLENSFSIMGSAERFALFVSKQQVYAIPNKDASLVQDRVRLVKTFKAEWIEHRVDPRRGRARQKSSFWSSNRREQLRVCEVPRACPVKPCRKPGPASGRD